MWKRTCTCRVCWKHSADFIVTLYLTLPSNMQVQFKNMGMNEKKHVVSHSLSNVVKSLLLANRRTYTSTRKWKDWKQPINGTIKSWVIALHSNALYQFHTCSVLIYVLKNWYRATFKKKKVIFDQTMLLAHVPSSRMHHPFTRGSLELLFHTSCLWTLLLFGSSFFYVV